MGGPVSFSDFYRILADLGLGHTKVGSWLGYDDKHWFQITDAREVVLGRRAWDYLGLSEPREIPDPHADYAEAFFDYIKGFDS